MTEMSMRAGESCPTPDRIFAISDIQNLSIDFSELHRIRQSAYFHADTYKYTK